MLTSSFPSFFLFFLRQHFNLFTQVLTAFKLVWKPHPHAVADWRQGAFFFSVSFFLSLDGHPPVRRNCKKAGNIVAPVPVPTKGRALFGTWIQRFQCRAQRFHFPSFLFRFVCTFQSDRFPESSRRND